MPSTRSHVRYPTAANAITTYIAVLVASRTGEDPVAQGAVNDDRLLSALGAPRVAYNDGEVADVVGKAAVLFRSLVKNHPFLDGNKRTAVLLTVAFLERNGFKVVPYRWTGLALEVAAHEGNYPMRRLYQKVKKQCSYQGAPVGDGLRGALRTAFGTLFPPHLSMWAREEDRDLGEWTGSPEF